MIEIFATAVLYKLLLGFVEYHQKYVLLAHHVKLNALLDQTFSSLG